MTDRQLFEELFVRAGFTIEEDSDDLVLVIRSRNKADILMLEFTVAGELQNFRTYEDWRV